MYIDHILQNEEYIKQHYYTKRLDTIVLREIIKVRLDNINSLICTYWKLVKNMKRLDNIKVKNTFNNIVSYMKRLDIIVLVKIV